MNIILYLYKVIEKISSRKPKAQLRLPIFKSVQRVSQFSILNFQTNTFETYLFRRFESVKFSKNNLKIAYITPLKNILYDVLANNIVVTNGHRPLPKC